VEKSIVLFSYNQTKSVQKRNNQPANGKEMNVLRVSFAYIILFWKVENGKNEETLKEPIESVVASRLAVLI
jgi:hypothetical protein